MKLRHSILHVATLLGALPLGACATTVAGAASPAPPAPTLYAALGGESGMDRIAAEAVTIYITDPRTRDDFDNINPDRLRTRLRSQLCAIADGPCIYAGRSMAASHKALMITQAKFNAVAEGMQTAMERAGVPYATQNRMMARLAPLQREIVTR